MSSAFTIFNTTSGEVRQLYVGKESELPLQLRPGEDYLFGDFPVSDFWIDVESSPVAVERAPMPVVVEGSTITVPPTTEFVFMGPVAGKGIADATGVLEFVFSEPGEYTIFLTHSWYRQHEVTLHAS